MTKVASALAFTGAMLLGVVACTEVGDAILHRASTRAPKTNHEYQRESAPRFRTVWANVERIRYKEEGGRPAAGASWRANAIATIEGIDHEVIIGPISLGFPPGDQPPKMSALPPSVSPLALTVIYSDGTTEVVQ